MNEILGMMRRFVLRVLSIATQIGALSALLSVNVYAIEPLNMKHVTDADRIYFGSRLTPDQFEKLQKFVDHSCIASTLPCEKKIAAINETLHFIRAVTPVLRSASSNTEISVYAKKYSSSLANELAATTTALNEILPHYMNICASSVPK